MAHLQIKNIPPELHEALRQRAANEGLTMSQYVIQILEHEVSLPTQREWLARLSQEPVVLGIDAAGAVRETREERERELGRHLDRY
jgi:plasmid stability protein